MEPETSTALDQLQKSIQTFGSLAMAAESRDKMYRYQDALMQSLYSILEDCNCGEEEKLKAFNTTMEQYVSAMTELFPKLITGNVFQGGKKAVVKTAADIFDCIEEV